MVPESSLRHRQPMLRFVHGSIALACASTFAASTAASAVPIAQPLRFFEGRTESIGIMKMMMKKPYKVLSINRGTIAPDGALTLVQDVHDEGQPPRVRTWHIHQVGPHKYMGSMSDATGPVVIDEVGAGYRFRFNMHGGLAVEQWLIPNADGRSGTNTLTIRMYGLKVATSDGIIRKLPEAAAALP